MRSRSLPFLVLSTIVAVFLGFPSQPAQSSTDAQDLSPIAQSTFTAISKCLAPPDAQLNVLYLLDASSSLRETDPDGLREQILAQAISQLGAVASQRPVYLAVSSFDTGYSVRRNWERLEASNLGDAVAWAENQDAWWGAGQATNWLAALEGGQATMQQAPKPPDSEAQVCQVIVWFTDGGINVTQRSDFEAKANAIGEICGRNPVSDAPLNGAAIIDSIRSGSIHLIGVVLQDDEYLQDLAPEDRKVEESLLTFMRPITEGEGLVDTAGLTNGQGTRGQFLCGDVPVPPNWATGALLRGNNPFSLAYAFSDLTAAIQGIPTPGVDLGPTFPAEFEIEQGINFMTIQLAGTDWVLIGPNGATVAARAVNSISNDVAVSQQGDLAGITVQGASLAPGAWTLDVRSDDESLVPSARLYRDIRVDGVIEVSTLRAGEIGSVTVSFVDAVTGNPVDIGVYDFSPLKVVIEQGNRPAEDLDCALDPDIVVFRCDYTPVGPGTLAINAESTLTTLSGQFTTVYSGSLTKQVLPAPGFPTVSPDLIRLSDLDGRRGVASGQMLVQGPEDGSGDVCFPDSASIRVISDVVDRSKGYRVSGPPWDGGCVSVGQGESVTVDLGVSNETAATGTVELAFDVELRSASSERVESQQVRLTFDTIRQGSPPWWLLAALVILGFFVPIGLLYAQARAASRLSLAGLQTAIVPVMLEVTPGRVVVSRQQPPNSQLFQLDDWHWLPSSAKRHRTFAAAEGVTLRAVVPKSPVGPLGAEAVAPPGSKLITSEQGFAKGNGSVGKFELMPATQWFMVARESDLAGSGPLIPATLVGFANPSGGSLADVSKEMSLTVQDMQAMGPWETIIGAVTGSLNGGSARRTPGASGPESTTSQDDHHAAPPDPPGQAAADAQMRSPFDDLGSGSTAPRQSPASEKPSNVEDPFKDL